MTEQTKQDCFAFIPGKSECAALRERYCDREKCPFYKTREQADEASGA